MDTSPEYIKMCEKATEIQEFKNNHSVEKSTEWFFCKYCHVIADSVNDGYVTPCVCPDHLALWLPRQDQLQEIWRQEYLKHPSKHGWFGEFCNFMGEPYADGANADESFDTLEQIWLAFVMQKKYGKIWTGEEWVKA